MEFQVELEEELGSGAEDENLIVFKNLRLSDVVTFSTMDKKYVGRVVELSFDDDNNVAEFSILHLDSVLNGKTRS